MAVLKTLAKIGPNADPVFRDECMLYYIARERVLLYISVDGGSKFISSDYIMDFFLCVQLLFHGWQRWLKQTTVAGI